MNIGMLVSQVQWFAYLIVPLVITIVTSSSLAIENHKMVWLCTTLPTQC